jgi:hypothetical protein
MQTKNQYKVPVGQWRKWQEQERMLFNTMYSSMFDNMQLFLHPKQAAPKPEHWKTTAWNVAWIAADELRLQRKAQQESAK